MIYYPLLWFFSPVCSAQCIKGTILPLGLLFPEYRT